MPDLPKVLLLGDSIRMSYQPHVARLLDGRAAVVGPAENCQYSLYTLDSLDLWLEELGRPDIVHWNNGIHDVGHNPDRDPVQFPPGQYLANLERILEQLLALTPRVIWATTTPVHPDYPLREGEWSFCNEDINRYNQAARRLMEGRGVPVNDLHALVLGDPDRFLCEDMLHLSRAGEAACAHAVAASVSPFL